MSKTGFFLWRTKYRHIDLTPEQLAALLTVNQYAQKYNCSQSAVYDLIGTHRIDAYKMQSRWWIVDRKPLP